MPNPTSTSTLLTLPSLKLNADSAFQIGHDHISSHRPCQDYATHFTHGLGRCASAVISDGCSTGGRTDVGARIMALAAEQVITRHLCPGSLQYPYFIAQDRDQIISQVQSSLCLHPTDLYATSLFTYANSSGLYTFVQGDGAIGIRYTNGQIFSLRYEWLPVKIDGVERSVPFYPTYSSVERARFENLHLSSGLGDLRYEVTNSRGDRQLLSIAHGISGSNHFVNLADVRTDEHECPFEVSSVAVFSDGVSQVDNWTWQEVVHELMSVPNYHGEFVKRKLAFAIRKFKSRGKGPLDDISMAAIYIDRQTNSDDETNSADDC